MSFEATAWARRQREGLDSHAKFVLLLMADHANEHGRCYPSMPRLASDALLSRSTVARTIDRLERLELVVRLGVKWPGGPMEYALAIADTPSQPETGLSRQVRRGTPSQRETPPVSPGDTPPVSSGDTRITKNHHESPGHTLGVEQLLLSRFAEAAREEPK